MLAWLQSTNDADLHLASVTLKAEEVERWLDQLSGSREARTLQGPSLCGLRQLSLHQEQHPGEAMHRPVVVTGGGTAPTSGAGWRVIDARPGR